MSVIRLKDVATTQTIPSEFEKTSAPHKPIPCMLVVEFLRIYDIVAIAIAGFGGYTLYVLPDHADLVNRYPSSIVLGTAVAAVICHVSGAYRIELVFSRSLGARQALTGWLVTFALMLGAAIVLQISYSLVWAAAWLAIATGFLLGGRYVLSIATLRLARQGYLANRILIFGVGEQAARVAAHLRAHGDARVRIVGSVFVDQQGFYSRSQVSFDGHALIPDVKLMMEVIRQTACDEVIIALPWSEDGKIEQLANLLAMAPVRIRLAPDLAGFCFAHCRLTQWEGLPVLTLFDRPISGWSYVIKLIEDLAVALVALIFIAPLMFIIAAAIKIESPGPVFFRQRRLGFNDNVIDVWKFRTMRAECTDPDGSNQAMKHDPRVTRVGRFLRKWSLDELPQLFNVLRGDMSIVGPRPHALATKAAGKLFDEVVDRYAARHRVKPGITGWAQVNGWRGKTDTIDKIRTRVDYDLYYIDNWSVWFDFYIILKTIVAIFRTDNAY